jgi:NAD(P)-dependent dehydrogenase (short-subunit alcohol dehydrogenase family)
MHHLALSWAAETVNTRCRVNLFDPGIVATRLRKEAMPGENPATLRQPEDVADALAALCEPGETRNGEIIRFSRS